MLAKGNRDDLADLAKRDLAKPAAAKDQAGLGDAWWALRRKGNRAGKVGVRDAGAALDELALPQLTGLDKAARGEAARNFPNRGRARGLAQIANPRRRAKGERRAGLRARTVTGDKIVHAECLLDGNSTEFTSTAGFAYGEWPLVWVVTLDKTYQLREIRFKTYDHDPRASRYIVSTSLTERILGRGGPQSNTSSLWWQRITFRLGPSR